MLEDLGREEGCLSSQEEHLVEDRLLVEGRHLVEDRLLEEAKSRYFEVDKHSVVAVYYGVDTLHLVHYVGLVEQPVVQDILGHVWLLKI